MAAEFKEHYVAARKMHRTLNIEWLLRNEFISLRERKISKDYIYVNKAEGGDYAFVGEHDAVQLPSGFCRCVQYNGNIYEGNIGPDLRLDGFCIIYVGRTKEITMGWYR